MLSIAAQQEQLLVARSLTTIVVRTGSSNLVTASRKVADRHASPALRLPRPSKAVFICSPSMPEPIPT